MTAGTIGQPRRPLRSRQVVLAGIGRQMRWAARGCTMAGPIVWQSRRSGGAIELPISEAEDVELVQLPLLEPAVGDPCPAQAFCQACARAPARPEV